MDQTSSIEDHAFDETDLENLTSNMENASEPQCGILKQYSTPSMICGIVMILTACTGIIGNVITAVVFSVKKKSKLAPTSSTSILAAGCSYMSAISGSSQNTSASYNSQLSSIAILVTGLACVDAILLTLSCPLFASTAIYGYCPSLDLLNSISYMTFYILPWVGVFQTASVWILSMITIERYIAVVYPFLARRVCTPSRAKLALFIIIITSAAYNASKFWEYRLERMEAIDVPDMVLILAEPLLRSNPEYINIYVNWMYFVFIFALPFAILVGFNSGVIRTVRLARRNRQTLSRQQTKEQGTAVMMVLVAFVFMICNTLAFVLNAIDVFGGSGAHRVSIPSSDISPIRHSPSFYILVDFNNLLVMTHCSINFFVYYNFSERFRMDLYRSMRRCRYCLSNRLRGAQSTISIDDENASACVKKGSVVSSHLNQTPPSRRLLRRYSSRGGYSGSSCTSGRAVILSSGIGWTIAEAGNRPSRQLSKIQNSCDEHTVRMSV